MKKLKTFDNIFYVLKYIFKHCPKYFVARIMERALFAINEFVEFTLTLAFLVDCIQYNRPPIYAFGWIIGLCVLKLIKEIFVSYLMSSLDPKSVAEIDNIIKLELFRKAADIDLECYDNPEYYNDFVWAMGEASDRMIKTLHTVAFILRCIITFLLNGVFILTFDYLGIAFVVVSVGLNFFLNVVINKLRFKLDIDLKPLKRKKDYINRVFYLNDFSKEIRLSNVKNKMFSDFHRVKDDMEGVIDKQTKRIARLSFIKDYFCRSFILDGLYIIYLLLRTIVFKTLSYGSMVGLFSAANGLRYGLQHFAQILPELGQHSLYIDKIRYFLQYEKKIIDKENALDVRMGAKDIEIKNVCFAYSESSPPILHDINIKIKAGEKVAFVGYNGAGKTTLIKLLMRLYDVTGGEIVYDGVNISDYKIDEYRNIFATVFQDYQLFATTLAQNVVMKDSEIDEVKVKQALDESGFGERMKALERGIDTYITKEFDEAGTNVSMGEAQKIAISRALYKECGIIILDEPSSALDPIAEYNLNNTILKYSKDKTVIFISHRLSTTKLADRIYMLENGHIIEQGSHDELMELNGKYAEMFILQSEKYKLYEI